VHELVKKYIQRAAFYYFFYYFSNDFIIITHTQNFAV